MPAADKEPETKAAPAPAPAPAGANPCPAREAVAPEKPRAGVRPSRAITTPTNIPAVLSAAAADTDEIRDPAREAVLISLEKELLNLLSQTSAALVRVKRLPTAAAIVGAERRRGAPRPPSAAPGTGDLPVQSPFGTISMGQEAAQNIERRARGLLLENNLTHYQQGRIERILQSSQDLLCALQAARYAWQMAILLPQEGHSGQTALPRLKRVIESAIEMSSQVALAVEGREGATAAVAEQYRAFLTVKEETSVHFSRWRENGILSQTARRLVRAALWSITVAVESMAKVAARFTLPLESSRDAGKAHEKYKHLDRGDDLLAPLRRR